MSELTSQSNDAIPTRHNNRITCNVTERHWEEDGSGVSGNNRAVGDDSRCDGGGGGGSGVMHEDWSAKNTGKVERKSEEKERTRTRTTKMKTKKMTRK